MGAGNMSGSDDKCQVTPEEQHAIFAAGKTMKDYLAGWNMRIGSAALENKRIVDDVIDEKLEALQRGLKTRASSVDIKEHTDYLMRSPRLKEVKNRDALASYISLYLFHGLEEFRKANRLKFSYIARK